MQPLDSLRVQREMEHFWRHRPTPARRRTTRRGVRIGCEAVMESGFRLLSRTGLDLSERGMLVAVHDTSVQVGESVVIAFQAPGTQFWVDAVAEVSRLVLGRRRSDLGTRAVGLRFVDMCGSDRAVLSARLERLPAMVPVRRTPVDYASVVREIGRG